MLNLALKVSTSALVLKDVRNPFFLLRQLRKNMNERGRRKKSLLINFMMADMVSGEI